MNSKRTIEAAQSQSNQEDGTYSGKFRQDGQLRIVQSQSDSITNMLKKS